MDEDEDDGQPHKLCCIICKSPKSQLDKNLSFVKRGIENLIDYSVLVSDERLKDELLSRKSRNIQVRIHRDCQRGVYNTMKKSAGTLRMQEERLKQGFRSQLQQDHVSKVLIGQLNACSVKLNVQQMKVILIANTGEKSKFFLCVKISYRYVIPEVMIVHSV